MASPVRPEDRKITTGRDGAISIPAAAYSKPSGNTRDVVAMKSFGGGLQVFLLEFGLVIVLRNDDVVFGFPRRPFNARDFARSLLGLQ